MSACERSTHPLQSVRYVTSRLNCAAATIVSAIWGAWMVIDTFMGFQGKAMALRRAVTRLPGVTKKA